VIELAAIEAARARIAAVAVRTLAERARVIAEGASALRHRRRARGPGGDRNGRVHRVGWEHRSYG